jgi:hypothetical protein
VAQVKMELADILLLKKKIQSGINLLFSDWDGFENDVVAHEASLKLLKRVILKLILCGHWNSSRN